MMVVAVMLFAWQGTAQDITKDQLPEGIVNWIDQHFPDKQLEEVNVEAENNMQMFMVTMEEDLELKFNEQGEVMMIKSEERIPDEALPESIVTYVNENYPETYVVEWEMDMEENMHLVELEDGTSLEFDSEGNFIGEDEGIW